MWLTVEDVLQLDVLREAQVIAGREGLGRSVGSVTVLDAPDAALWLKGQELALTSTFPLTKRRNGLKSLIDELVSRNVAGLGVKLHRYMTELPPTFIARADELAFPIIVVPDYIAWIEIINPIFSRVLETDAQKLIRSEEIRSQFTSLLFSGASLETMVARLHAMLDLPVVMVSPTDGQCICVPEDSELMPRALSLLHATDVPVEPVARGHGVLRRRADGFSVIYLPIDHGADLNACIAAIETDARVNEAALLCLAHGRDAISIGLLQRRASDSIVREKQNEFVLTLVDPTLSVTARKAHIARGREKGLPLHDRYFAAIIKFHDLDETTFRTLSSHFHARLQSDHLLSCNLDSSRFLLLIPETDESGFAEDGGIRCVRRYIEAAIASKPRLAWNAGISQAMELARIDRSFEQADYALRHSLRSGQKCLAKQHDETGLYRLLAHPALQTDAQRFMSDWLEPLLNYDSKHKSRLVETLRAFLDNNGNHRETARQMHVHHNTVRYRIAQIYKLTRRNILNPKLRLQYELALLLHDLTKDKVSDG